MENLRSYRKAKQTADQPLVEEEKKSSRVVSIDVFRGIALCCMIFANYHAGSYQRALVHAVWDGITFSDFAFPLSPPLSPPTVDSSSSRAFLCVSRSTVPSGRT